jgi:type II restriction enzyme
VTAELEKVSRTVRKLRGRSVKRPRGTLSGHAAGLPFEDLVSEQLRVSFRGRTYRHFELLNHLFANSPRLTTSEGRNSLLGPPSLQGLLRRGKKVTNEWTKKRQFSEKQNDTAETIILPSRKLEIRSNGGKPLILVDVKTQNNDKRSQPPNIISANKVANFCRAALEFEDRLAFRIFYVAIKWQASKSRLTCSDTRVVS